MTAGDLPPLRDVVKKHGLRPLRSLGQNYLFDLNLTAKIARAAGDLDSGTTIEIGPGPGGLTRALLASGVRELIAIERDRRCLPALAEVAARYPGRLTVIEGDALKIDIHRLGQEPRRVVANLPYNIGTELLLRWLDHAHAFEAFTLMLQKEVVDRLIAKPKSKDYGRLSVLVQWLTQPARLFDVPPRAFVPPPAVTSSVVRLTIRATPLYPADKTALERVTAAAFGQRRKMLRQSLKAICSNPEATLAGLGIDATWRAEQLSIEQFCALARALV